MFGICVDVYMVGDVGGIEGEEFVSGNIEKGGLNI